MVIACCRSLVSHFNTRWVVWVKNTQLLFTFNLTRGKLWRWRSPGGIVSTLYIKPYQRITISNMETALNNHMYFILHFHKFKVWKHVSIMAWCISRPVEDIAQAIPYSRPCQRPRQPLGVEPRHLWPCECPRGHDFFLWASAGAGDLTALWPETNHMTISRTARWLPGALARLSDKLL